jgi:excisionase family DNA binding protein
MYGSRSIAMNHTMPRPQRAMNRECVMSVVEADVESLTLKEVSVLLRVDCSTLRKMIKQGKIPGCASAKIGRFRKDVILRWAGGL